MEKRVINLVNFVRGCEPRRELDLFAPVKLELETDRRYHLPHTFLLQYDAMEREDFRTLFQRELKENASLTELGVWFEMSRGLIEKLGMVWRGRPGYDWDWHVDPGFLEAYTVSQREKIIDEVFGRFREIFGFFPSVAGSWLLDAHSMQYMSEKYDMKAFCICREQFAVDAYTLWGGYYSGAYYPSRKNMFIPAQTEKMQISTPVFRMLGIDPIYGYDDMKYGPDPSVGRCFTMEPCWKSGQSKRIMEWYFEQYYGNAVLNYSHATTGQENSFGFDSINKGYPMQAELISRWRADGKLAVETLGESGEKFAASYAITPPSVLAALSDWAGKGHQSVWYSSRFYRANLFLHEKHLFFRDIRKYDENYAERYLENPCEQIDAVYDAFPLADGFLYSDGADVCELSVGDGVRNITAETEEDILKIKVFFENGSEAQIIFRENEMMIKSSGALIYRPGKNGKNVHSFEKGFQCRYAGCEYTVLTSVAPEKLGDGYILKADEVTFTFDKSFEDL